MLNRCNNLVYKILCSYYKDVLFLNNGPKQWFLAQLIASPSFPDNWHSVRHCLPVDWNSLNVDIPKTEPAFSSFLFSLQVCSIKLSYCVLHSSYSAPHALVLHPYA